MRSESKVDVRLWCEIARPDRSRLLDGCTHGLNIAVELGVLPEAQDVLVPSFLLHRYPATKGVTDVEEIATHHLLAVRQGSLQAIQSCLVDRQFYGPVDRVRCRSVVAMRSSSKRLESEAA